MVPVAPAGGGGEVAGTRQRTRLASLHPGANRRPHGGGVSGDDGGDSWELIGTLGTRRNFSNIILSSAWNERKQTSVY